MEQNKIKNVFVNGAISPIFVGEAIAKHTNKKNIGAHSIFLGQVRCDLIENNSVVAIHYSAYMEMAEERLHEIRESIFKKYNLICMHIYHSLGRVEAGGICLFVFTSSIHRKDSIDACTEIVERIKNEVAIWGKELFEDESFVWKNPA
jgi:molybdopterin synthase catalytic subunit